MKTSSDLPEADPQLMTVPIVTGATFIGYDPGIVYYSITYREGGVEKTAKLSDLENAAHGVGFGRGMDINPSALALYQAAKAVACAAEKKRCWGDEPKKHIG